MSKRKDIIMGFIMALVPFLHIQLLVFGTTLNGDTEVLSGSLERGGEEAATHAGEMTEVGSLFQKHK